MSILLLIVAILWSSYIVGLFIGLILAANKIVRIVKERL